MDKKEKFAGAGLRGGRRIEGGPQMSQLMLTWTHQRRIIFYSGNLRACLMPHSSGAPTLPQSQTPACNLECEF